MVRDAYLQNQVLTADPLELIHMLYQRALDLVREARQALSTGDIAGRGMAISRTVEILGELEGALNHETGGEISVNLGRLYQYMMRRLTEANIRRQDAPLAEVEELLGTLGEAWSAIRPSVGNGVPTPSEGISATGSWPGQIPTTVEYSQASHNWTA